MISKAPSLCKKKAVGLFYIVLLFGGQVLCAQVPEIYYCEKATDPITIDGLASEEGWQKALWTNPFVDIEGNKKPKPYLDTRVKMLWDQDYFYFYAEMEEPHLWAKLKQRDTVIFYDNDFEVFIDPDGDTHNYYELELNAFNTVWDLLLTRPYRDGGHAIDHWDIHGLKSAVNLKGTLNDPSDTDEGWSVEIAIPWEVLSEASRQKTPPLHGDIWRVNFSRVQWETVVENGRYVKKQDPDTGKRLPENNWVWSPMRVIAMHEPEFWGLVQFVSEPGDMTMTDEQAFELEAKSLLYDIHRALKVLARKKQSYAGNLEDLGLSPFEYKGQKAEVKIFAHVSGYLVHLSHPGLNDDWMLDQTGRSWKVNK